MPSSDTRTSTSLAGHANFAFTADRKLSARANYLKVQLMSGYKDQHWGLGEIEVFGTGATMLPEDDINYVNAQSVVRQRRHRSLS